MKFSNFFYLLEAQEYFTLEFEDNNTVLVIRSNQRRNWIEVRGKKGYETKHDNRDSLHRFLDKLDPATISNLFAGEKISVNPKNPRSAPSIAAIEELFRKNK